MAVTYNKMLLDINEKPNDIITAVQNDTNSRYLDVLLYDNGTPIDLTGCEVKIFMKKPENGGEIWNDGVITEVENGRCEFLLTTEALAKMGHLQVQISIWKKNTEILSSQIFEIIVTKSLLGESSVESSNEYGTLVVLFQNLYEALTAMEIMVENFGLPGETAKEVPAATFWQMLEAVYTVNAEALKNASVSEVLTRLGLTDDSGGTAITGTVMAKLNAIFTYAKGGVEYFKAGTYELKIPEGVTSVTITACGAGGGGEGGTEPYAGLTGGTGTNGEPTIIGDLVTLAGGEAGGNGGDGGGTNGKAGGRGAYYGSNAAKGEDSSVASGGKAGTKSNPNVGGGGGGAAVGNGGDGADAGTTPFEEGSDGEKGGGGGGGAAIVNTNVSGGSGHGGRGGGSGDFIISVAFEVEEGAILTIIVGEGGKGGEAGSPNFTSGGNGGDGYVKIAWGAL